MINILGKTVAQGVGSVVEKKISETMKKACERQPSCKSEPWIDSLHLLEEP